MNTKDLTSPNNNNGNDTTSHFSHGPTVPNNIDNNNIIAQSSNASASGSETDNDNALRSQSGDYQKRTPAEKKMDRILANRRSARRSRERRKKLQENLEVSVAFLSKQNEELTQENTMLRHELRVLINLVNQMTKQVPVAPPSDTGIESLLHQIRTAAAASAPAPAPVDQLKTDSSMSTINNSINHAIANSPATMFSGTNNNVLNGLTPERILALSQLLANSQNQNSQQYYLG